MRVYNTQFGFFFVTGLNLKSYKLIIWVLFFRHYKSRNRDFLVWNANGILADCANFLNNAERADILVNSYK